MEVRWRWLAQKGGRPSNGVAWRIAFSEASSSRLSTGLRFARADYEAREMCVLQRQAHRGGVSWVTVAVEGVVLKDRESVRLRSLVRNWR